MPSLVAVFVRTISAHDLKRGLVAFVVILMIATVVLVGVELRRDASMLDRGLGVAMRLVWLAALGATMVGLRRAPWGDDVTWFDGRWVPSREVSELAGEPNQELQAVHEAPGSHTGVTVNAWIFGGLALVAIPGAALAYREHPIGSGSTILLALGVLGFAGWAVLSTVTRVVHADARGLRDASYFDTRRVPFGMVSQVRRLNTSAAAQASYDERSRAGHRNQGMRPRTVWAWRVLDRTGQRILDLPDDLVPAEAWAAMRRHIATHVPLSDDERPPYIPEDDEPE